MAHRLKDMSTMVHEHVMSARRVLFAHGDPAAAAGSVPDGAAGYGPGAAEAGAVAGRRVRYHLVHPAGAPSHPRVVQALITQMLRTLICANLLSVTFGPRLRLTRCTYSHALLPAKL